MGQQAWYVCDTVTDESGRFIPLLVDEDIKGYSPSHSRWDCTFKQAQNRVDDLNKSMFKLSRKEALHVVHNSMFKAKRKKAVPA